MAQSHAANLVHLGWAVENRARNQRCALKLLSLFTKHEKKWQSKKRSRAAQDLLSVVFSLWRAAFLAEKTAHRADVFANAVLFLEHLIADNAISYVQDRKCNEWTFNYYTKNARAALVMLAAHWPDQVAPYEDANRTPTERWEYCQGLLDDAVAKFETLLEAPKHSGRGAARRAARERRRMSREVTLAAKKAAASQVPKA